MPPRTLEQQVSDLTERVFQIEHGGASIRYPLDSISQSIFQQQLLKLGFERLGEVILPVAANALRIRDFASRKNFLVLVHSPGRSASAGIQLTFNGDTGTNYGYRYEENGATDVTSPNAANIVLDGGGYSQLSMIVMYVQNFPAQQKTIFSSGTFPGAAAAAPSRVVTVGVWNNTSGPITEIAMILTPGTSNWNADSRMTVFATTTDLLICPT